MISTGLTADGLAVDGAGVVYLPDDHSTNARVYTLTPDATGTTYTPSSFDVTGVGNFRVASGITVIPSGDIIVSDSENDRLVVVSGAAVGAIGYTVPGNQAATPELGSDELLASGLLPLGAVLLYRRRRARQATQPQ